MEATTLTKQTKKRDKNFIFAVGRRKEAVARVHLHDGRGVHSVNGQAFEQYFPGQEAAILLKRPFEIAAAEGTCWVSAKVKGGGKQGQLEAVVLGIARALGVSDAARRTRLKRHHLLTRDARIRERRKVGTGGKARRKKQSPKR